MMKVCQKQKALRKHFLSRRLPSILTPYLSLSYLCVVANVLRSWALHSVPVCSCPFACFSAHISQAARPRDKPEPCI